MTISRQANKIVFKVFTGETGYSQSVAVDEAMRLMEEFLEAHPAVEVVGFDTAATMAVVVEDRSGYDYSNWWHTHTVTLCYKELLP